jgi:hypothetical protein
VVDDGDSTPPASTAVHGLTRDLPTPRMGSRASSFSPRDPSSVQLLREAANWCLQCPLRVLLFDLKRAEIRVLWLPIYRGFSLILKRIRSRSCFDPSIKLISALVSFNPKGKTPDVIRVQDELGRAAVLGPATLSQLGSARLIGGLPGRARWNFLGRYAGCAQGREPEPGWASEGVSVHGQ